MSGALCTENTDPRCSDHVTLRIGTSYRSSAWASQPGGSSLQPLWGYLLDRTWEGQAGSQARVRRVLLAQEQAAKSEVLWRVHLWVGLWAHGSMSLQGKSLGGKHECEITLEERWEGLERLGQKKSPTAAVCEVDGQARPVEETWCIFKGPSAILEFEPEWGGVLRQGLTNCPFLWFWRIQNVFGLKRADALRSKGCPPSTTTPPPNKTKQNTLWYGPSTLFLVSSVSFPHSHTTFSTLQGFQHRAPLTLFRLIQN